MISLQTTKNMQRVSFIFFIVLGLAHLVSGLSLKNGYAPEVNAILSRILFVPFSLAALCYGVATIKEHLMMRNKDRLLYDYLLISTASFILACLIALQFLIPSAG